eukprot:10387493-Ditylum_brightwellii.AAC.1
MEHARVVKKAIASLSDESEEAVNFVDTADFFSHEDDDLALGEKATYRFQNMSEEEEEYNLPFTLDGALRYK